MKVYLESTINNCPPRTTLKCIHLYTDRTPPKTTLALPQDTFFYLTAKKTQQKNYKFKSEK